MQTEVEVYGIGRRRLQRGLPQKNAATARWTGFIVATISACLPAFPAFADQIYVSTSTDVFIEYDTATGNYTFLGEPQTEFGHGFSGMGYATGGVLHANENLGSDLEEPDESLLYQVSFQDVPLNGVLAPIPGNGNINDTTDPDCLSCEINSAPPGAMTAGGGTLYYIDHTNNLYGLSPATLDTDPAGSQPQAVEIGPPGTAFSDFDNGVFGPDRSEFSLGFGPDGNLYAANALGKLYLINTSTDAATLFGVVPNGLDAGNGLPPTLISGDGNRYAFAGNEMFSINLTNGQATFVRDAPDGLGNFESAVAVPASSSGAPGPATVFSMLGGLALLARIVRSSRGRSV